MRRYKHIYVKGYTSSDSYMIESPEGEYIRMEEGEQVIKWHKVEYGLPEKDGDYLLSIYLELFNISVSRSGYFYSKENIFVSMGESNIKVTHWAELPKPEEGE